MALRGEEIEVNEWKSRLSLAQNFRSNWAEYDWRRSLAQYEGQRWDGTAKDIPVNLSFPSIKVLLRSSISSDPYIYVKPTRPEFVLSSDMLEFLLNDAWRSQRRKKAARRVVLDTLLLKVGYTLSHLKYNKISKQHDSVMTRVSPVHLWNDGALNIEDSYFVIRKIVMSWEKAKKLPGKGAKDIPPANYYDIYGDFEREINTLHTKFGEGVIADDRMSRAILYEVHDQLNGEISVFHEGIPRYIIKPRPSPYATQSLFTKWEFNERIFNHYGIGDLEPATFQQEELNRVRKNMAIHDRRFNRKYITSRDNFDKEEMTRLESDEDGVIVTCADPEAFDPIKDAPVSPDKYAYHNIIRTDHREILGIDEYQRGGDVPGQKTAFETSQIVQGRQARQGEKADLVDDAITEISYKDIEIMKKFYGSERVVRLIGPQGVYWPLVKNDQLQGVHRVSMQAGSTEPRNPSADFQKGVILYQTFGNDPNVDPMVLRDIVFRLMNVPFRSRLLKQQPLAQQSAQDMGQGQGGGGQTGPQRGTNPQAQNMASPRALADALRAPGQNQGGV